MSASIPQELIEHVAKVIDDVEASPMQTLQQRRAEAVIPVVWNWCPLAPPSLVGAPAGTHTFAVFSVGPDGNRISGQSSAARAFCIHCWRPA